MSPTTVTADPAADSIPTAAPAQPTAPDGWIEDCRAARWAMDYFDYYSEYPSRSPVGQPVDLVVPTPSWEELMPGDRGPTQCRVRGDFDGDATIDEAAWVFHETTYRFDIVVYWGDGRRSLMVEDNPAAAFHVHSGAPTYALTRWTLTEVLRRSEEDDEPMRLATPGDPALSGLGLRHEALSFRDVTRTFVASFYEGAWHAALFNSEDGPAVPARRRESPGIETLRPSSNACRRARARRRASFRAWSSRIVEWVRPSQVARDDCNGSADFDGDGELDRFAWVERDGLSGLRIERSAGPAAVLGAGAHLHIDPWGGEPGFTRHGESLNGIVRVQTAAWTGEHWELPGGSIHTPTVITGIAGDALVWTSQRGHSDLVFLANGSWHLSAVRFPWESVRVLDVHMSGEWMWSPPPLPELRSHVRPSALDERTLQIYKPGPIPVPGAYPGQTREFYVGYPPQPLPN